MNDLDPNMLIALAAFAGYLLGSIPWGLVLTRMAGLGDIRKIGSGNIGATNVLRTGHKFLAFLTLILDASKGAVAALIFMQFYEVAGIVAGFAAVLGHNFSIWLKFQGGKGVATSLGAILIVSWPVGVLTCCAWLIITGTFRFSSVASMGSLAATPIITWWFSGNTTIMIMTAGLAVLTMVRHKENIVRLIRGEETRIGQKKDKTE
jgi:glycerol-3-phosphate acyltransferase PlsY